MIGLAEEPKRANVLIADDTQTNRRLLSTILTTNGYQVCEASDGQTTLDNARAILPDLLLLDIRMPGMDGYEVCRELKKCEVTRNIPVIFVSALDDQTDKVLGFAAGGVDYITKPFQTKEILARIETHLTLRNLQRQLEAQNLLLQQEIAERRRIEYELQRSNEMLEKRVNERTIELRSANKILSREVQEHSLAEEALRKSQADKETLLEQVRKQEQQVREIMNTVPEGVLLLDGTGRILQANQVAKADLRVLLDTQEGEILNRFGTKELKDLLAPPPHGLWHEVTINSHIFEAAIRPTAEDPADQRWVMVLRDVTREREFESHSQQQERLAAVGQLAAGIAHDFNNILAVIMLYTEMALGSADLTPRMSERLTTISQQSRRATELIQQILDFSRRTKLERHALDLLPFLKEQIKLLERTLPENIRLDLDSKNGSYMVYADITRMQQTIMNLAFNARDAMPEGGRLSIQLDRLESSGTIHCVACGAVHSGDWIKIQVSDSGGGIPPDVLPHIFEPFFTTKIHGQGTGLGLSQVCGIVEAHKGHVDVVTSSPNGTTFTLYLPAYKVIKSIENVSDAKTDIHGNGQKILLVEDDPTTRQALMEGLSLINYQVISTQNGLEALNYLAGNPDLVDLVLSDVVMPEMGGMALLKAIRQGGYQIPVILMTGHPLQKELDDLLNDGLTAWLSKPPRLKHLAQLIEGSFKETYTE